MTRPVLGRRRRLAGRLCGVHAQVSSAAELALETWADAPDDALAEETCRLAGFLGAELELRRGPP